MQELYAGPPITFLARHPAPSDTAILLAAERKAPAFVPPCRSGLPAERQRTRESRFCSQGSCGRLEYAGQMPSLEYVGPTSGPRPVDLLSAEPAGKVVLAGNEFGSSAEPGCLQGRRSEDAEALKGPRGVAEDSLVCFSLASEAACWPGKEEPRLIQEGKACLRRPPQSDRAVSLQSLEENRANSHMSANNLPNPTKEVPGRKADMTELFGKAGENSPPLSPGVPPGTGEHSEGETVMTKVEVSEASTLDLREHVGVPENALARARLQGEEEHRGPRPAMTSSLSVLEKPLIQVQKVGAALAHDLASRRGQMNLPVSQSETIDVCPKLSTCLFQDGLELGHFLWEEDTDVFEVVCETLEKESPLGNCGHLGDAVSCENTALLEEQASLVSTRERMSATCNRVELSRDTDAGQGTRENRTDHSYTRVCEGNIETEEGNPVESYWKEMQAGPPSENSQQEPFSEEQNIHPKTDTSFLADGGCSALEEHSDDLKSVLLAPDSVQRDELQQYSVSKGGRLASVLEGSASPWNEVGSSACFPTSTLPLPTCHVPFGCDRESCKESLQQVKSASEGTETNTSATSVPAIRFSRVADAGLVGDEENPPVAQPSNKHLFPPEGGMISSTGGFLDSLPDEISGTPEKLRRQHAACPIANEKGLLSAKQTGSGFADRSRAPQRSTPRTALGSHASCPFHQHGSCPCSAAEDCRSVLGSVCLGDRALKTRTETATEQVNGLGTCHPPVSTRMVGPPQEFRGNEAQDSPSYGNNRSGLDGAESSSASFCSLRTTSPSLSRAEALESDAKVEGQEMADDSCMGAEETLDIDSCIGLCDTSLEQGPIAALSRVRPAGSVRVESKEGKEDSRGSGANDNGHLEELGRLVKNHAKESQSSEHHHNHLHRPGSPDQESKTPERDILKGQQHLLIVSSWQETVVAVQAVTRSDTEAQKLASCKPNESLCLQSDTIVIPPAPELAVPNAVQQAIQQSVTGSYFSNGTAPESVSGPLEGELVELMNPAPPLEYTSKQLEWDRPVKEWSVEPGAPDIQVKNHSQFSSDSASPSDQDGVYTAPRPLAVVDGRNCTSSRWRQNKKPSSLIRRNRGTSLFQKDEPSASPHPDVLFRFLTPKYPAPAALFEREGGRHVGSLTSGKDKRSGYRKAGTDVGFAPSSKEILAGTGSTADAIVCATLRNVDPSWKMTLSLEDLPRSQRAEKADLPVCSLSDDVGSSVPFSLECSAGEDLAIGGPAQPSNGLFLTGSSGDLLNTVPGDNASEASPKRLRRRWQRAEGSRQPAGVKWKSPTHKVNKDAKAPVRNTRASGAGSFQELGAKVPQKEACRSVASWDGLRAGAKGQAECLLKRRVLRAKQALGGLASKPECLARQALGVRKNKSIWSTLRDSKRPKISKELVASDCLKAGSSSLSEENHGWTSTGTSIYLTSASSKWTQTVGSRKDEIGSAFESQHQIRHSLPFRRPPGKAWGTCSGPAQFQAGRRSNPVSSACLENLLEVFPQHESKRFDCANPGLPTGAVREAGVVLWRRPPKARASRSGLLGPVGFGQLAKDQVVLRRLSALADKLLTPPRSSTKLLPLTRRRCLLLSQKLLDVLSCVNVELSSWWANDGSHGLKTWSSMSVTLSHVESLSPCFWDPGLKAPISVSAPLFPVLFHIKVGLFPVRKLLRIASPQNQVVSGEREAATKPLSWMLSFLFPGICLDEEGAWTPTQASLLARKDRMEDAATQRRTDRPTCGLQTILALSSPRCYRLWMKRRHLAPGCSLGAQKLTVLQLVQGLKGFACSSPASADSFSSVPHSLGRVLTLWGQHGPSTCLPAFPPLHSNHCTRQPVTPAMTSPGLWNRVEPPFPAFLPTLCSGSESVLSSLGLPAPEFQLHALDDRDVSLPALPKTGRCLENADLEKRPKKVSQIRIRKTVPKPDPNLTPMGLPRPKRLKKKEFSLEEIYTNKNYKSPPTTRCLETIFEEPKERNGSLISVSQQKRKRILEFQDFTVPRKRRVRSRVKVLGGFTRAQKAALGGRELDVLLIQKLTDLETFFAEELGEGAGC